ncbi:MAG: DUF349 domain-containing protein [Bacteroidales bacterium]|nr:DUF349 domain-containing protein [Bacteroidales bacterium]
MNEDLKTIAPEQEQEPVAPEQDVLNETAPVVENEQEEIDLSNKGLKELLDVFQDLLDKGDVQKLYKYAEGIKAAFYKTLKKEKMAMGFQTPAEGVENPDGEQVSNNPFGELERGFKDLFGQYKVLRTSYLQELNSRKDENYKIKSEVVEELKLLVENPEDLNKAYPKFRELQAKWRTAGAVPAQKAADLYETYSHYVEMFYDYVKINREFRDLDFKKNLEAKQSLCEKAEQLSESENPVSAFRTLQTLHEQWKELGPVDKEYRDSIWERFRAATAVVNKKYQEYFDSQKEVHKQNLEAKIALCERVEAIASSEVKDSNTWNQLSKEVESIQKEWRTIGFASKKENQKVYDRFRAACDKFYAMKRDFYSDFKNQMQENLDKKLALCEQAEAVMNSEDWKATSDLLIDLQKQWKEIGPVSRKKSEQIWKRFRAACDTFFDNRDKKSGGKDNSFAENLVAKNTLIADINAYELSADEQENADALKAFQDRWASIGFVPFKEKEATQKAYNKVLADKFGVTHTGKKRSSEGRGRQTSSKPQSEKERLIAKYIKMEQDIATWENNMGFFSKSKNTDALLADQSVQIEAAKAELAQLAEKIKSLEKQEEE